jgi:DNA topoisomerase-1
MQFIWFLFILLGSLSPSDATATCNKTTRQLLRTTRLHRTDLRKYGITCEQYVSLEHGGRTEREYFTPGPEETKVKVKGAGTLERIRQLSIPLTWQDIWINPNAQGHIQVRAKDSAGRTQYIFHPKWEPAAKAEKFRRVVEFGRKLALLREAIDSDIREPSLSRERVIAGILRLQELTLFPSVGQGTNRPGLCDLTKDGLIIKGDKIRIKLKGRKPVDIAQTTVRDYPLLILLSNLQKVRGGLTFRYLGKGDRPIRVTGKDINEYVSQKMGGKFLARDFRSWVANVLLAESLVKTPPKYEVGGRTTYLKQIVAQVAGVLDEEEKALSDGHLHPDILKAYRTNGRDWQAMREAFRRPGLPPHWLKPAEDSLLIFFGSSSEESASAG